MTVVIDLSPAGNGALVNKSVYVHLFCFPVGVVLCSPWIPRDAFLLLCFR